MVLSYTTITSLERDMTCMSHLWVQIREAVFLVHGKEDAECEFWGKLGMFSFKETSSGW